MSQGAAIALAEAYATAVDLVALLEPACVRIEIAGSIRRRKPEVHDIEIVAIGRVGSIETGLFGGATEEIDDLDVLVSGLVGLGTLERRLVEDHRRDGTVTTGYRMGRKYKALVYAGVPVDLFATDAARWGCIFALRTGPGDWNTALVTRAKDHWRRVEDGRVLYHQHPLPTPEEPDFFRALGVPWIDPPDRRVDALRFDPQLLRDVPGPVPASTQP